MTAGDEICRMDATSLARQVAAKQLSPVEVVDAVLDRLDRLDPRLHIFATVSADRARQEAKRLEAEIAAGREVGPLAGVPTGVKDLIYTKGIRTASGSNAYADFVPDEDDVVVERITAAGAIVIGKTQVPEFGYSGTGQTPLAEPTGNPWNPDRTSGGSSAGSGAAVATGIGPFSLGSDGGGSVRIPASFCGVYGIKPTMGRVPLYPGTKDERYPGVSSWESLEHIGPLTRTVADAALVLSVIAGYDERDRLSIRSDDVDWLRATDGDLRGLRVAYSPDLGYAAVDPAVRADRRPGRRRCSSATSAPRWSAPTPAGRTPTKRCLPLILAESDLAGMRALADELGDRMSPHLVDVLRVDWTAEQLTSAVVGRKAVYNAAVAVLPLLRPAAHPDPGRAAVRARPAGAVGDRRPRGRRLLLAVVHVPVQLHRPARRDRAGRVHRRRTAGRACRSSDAGWTTRSCCGRPPRSRPPRRGATAGRLS